MKVKMMREAPFAAMEGRRYLSLTTFRKNGDAVPTMVWFAQQDDTLFMMTRVDTGKIKRLHNNGMVEVAPCTREGIPLSTSVEATARVVPLEHELIAHQALAAKYPLRKRLYEFWIWLRGYRIVYLEITPM